MPQHHRAAPRRREIAHVALARDRRHAAAVDIHARTAASARDRSPWRAACGRRRATSRCCTERSQFGATSRTVPSCMTLMRKRSASKPGRLIASQARSPLRRYTGCVSHAGLSAVRFRGAAAAVRRRLVQIEIRRPRFFAPGHACAEHHARAVGAERVFLGAAVGLGRHVRVQRSGSRSRARRRGRRYSPAPRTGSSACRCSRYPSGARTGCRRCGRFPSSCPRRRAARACTSDRRNPGTLPC